MVESYMFFAMGFLLAALVLVVVVPLVHGRAVRLTRRHLECAIPTSMAEIVADKDLLRAEFAMSTRRLEIERDELKANSANDRAELSRKSDAIRRLTNELTALRTRLGPVQGNGAPNSVKHEATSPLPDQDADLTATPGANTATPAAARAQAEELTALRTQVETLSKWLTDAGAEIRTMHADHIELEVARQTLAEERFKFQDFHRRAAELVQQLIRQSANDKLKTARNWNSDASVADPSTLSDHHDMVEKPAA